MQKLRIATRGSALAVAQTEAVAELLRAEGVESEIVRITTKGDSNRVSPLIKIGGNGLFVREIEKALIQNGADAAVHCGKDLPYEIDERLVIAGVSAAADHRDCLISLKDRALPAKPLIGTGSPRRCSEYAGINENAVFKDIRGNVNTRLDKLDKGDYDALILAKAGLDRLGIDTAAFTIKVFEPSEMIPAACQGLLALECRKDDERTAGLLRKISDKKAFLRFEIERYMFCRMKADCSSAVGVYADIREDALELKAMFEGRRVEAKGTTADYRALCEKLYSGLFGKGEP